MGAVNIAADWVITAAGPLRDAWVTVGDGAIEWVGKAGARDAPPADVVALGHGVLMPGLVNAHGHLELSHLAGRIDPARGFVDWVEQLVAARAGAAAEEEVDAGIARGIHEAAATGTAAIGDVSNTLRSVAPLAGSSLRAVVFHELIGWIRLVLNVLHKEDRTTQHV